ncbi:MAG: insulinase family protein [Verrucomicrobia bacterium]|nr:insulinase family protein [Verrucomicrobiota bacterium]
MKQLLLPVLFLAALPLRAAEAPARGEPGRAARGEPGRTAAVVGFTFVKDAGGIAEYRLTANDLTVLLLEDHSAPVLTFMVTYRVGSRNEVTGTTGATHLLEHLMFKGSRNFHPGIGKGFDTLMDRIGGINNATTSLDRTNYYESLPSDHLELAIQLEADRMRGLLLREEDRQPEMTVVRNEFERDENDPASALDKEIGATAFLAHPYHHPIIGWRSDIEKVSIQKLREFYDTFYWPNNATVTVIGDFQPPVALRLIQQSFGAIARSPQPIPAIYTEEPAQSGARRVIVKRPGEVGVVQVAYKVPAALHPDHAPLEVLAAILSEGKTSRLYRALIDPNLAISADASKGFFHDNTLFTVTALLTPGTAHEQAEKTLLAETVKVKNDGVTAAEVGRAINKLLAGIAYGRDGSFAIAGQINESIAVGDWTHFASGPEHLKSVTAADVQRVARAYFNEDQSTTGWFIPQPEAARAESGAKTRSVKSESVEARRVKFAARGPHYYRDPEGRSLLLSRRSPAKAEAGDSAQTSRASLPAFGGARGDQGSLLPLSAPAAAGALIAPNVRRRQLAGLDVLTLKTSIKDVVTIGGVVAAGDVFNPPGNSAIADLTAGMLDQGTVKRDKFALSELLEQVGATLHFGTDAHVLKFAGKCLRQDLPLVLNLLAEQLRTPRFDPGEFAKLKQQLAGRHKRNMEETDFRANRAFARAIFPEGHPNRPPADDQYLADIEAATLEQLKAFHATHYGPPAARLVAVGDVDDAAIDRAIAAAFAGWQGGRAIPPSPKAPAVAAARTENVAMPGKTSVSVVVGQPSGLRYADAGYQSLNLATAIFGSGFFSARLLDIIRNREGLTYGIVASLSSDTYADGAWFIRGTFAPELLEQGTASTLRELRRFHDEGVTAEELATFKVTLTGSYQVALATTEGLAGALLNAVQRGYGPEWLDEFPHRLRAVTLAEANDAIKKYINPEKMVLVLAGTLPPAGAK